MTSKLLILLGCFLALAPCSRADLQLSYTASGNNVVSPNNPLSAKVDFDLNGSLLTVILTNTLTPIPSHFANNDALMAVFFGTNKIGATTGTAIAPETVNFSANPVCTTGTCDVSAGWAFENFAPARYSAMNGISATGLGIFGPSGNFKPDSGTKLGGVNYGVVPTNYAGGVVDNGRNVVKLLEENSAAFQLNLTGIAPTTLADLERMLGTVTFQYGTDLSEAHLRGTLQTSVPEPAEAVLLLTSLGLAAISRRWWRA